MRVGTALTIAMAAGLAWAEDLPSDTNTITTLTVEQARRVVDIYDEPRNDAERRVRDASLFSYGLELNGLTTLGDDVALELGRSVEGVALNGLSALSDGAARNLARCKGTLSFKGLKTLPVRTAKALARHVGGLDLSGLKTLPEDVAMALGQHEGELDLSGVETLSDEAAGGLGQHEGPLKLNSLKTLSDAAAVALAKNQGNLLLFKVSAISDAAAKALGRHRGELWLSKVTTLSDEAAMALSQHEGRVQFSSLSKLSLEAATALRSNPGIHLPYTVDPRRLLGLKLATHGDVDGSIRVFRQLATAFPTYEDPEYQIGRILSNARRYRDAIPHFERALELDRKHFLTRRALAEARSLIGDRKQAKADFEHALELKQDDPRTLNGLAWLLATAPEASLRNGARSIELATKGCEKSEWKDPAILSTLAAGHAETGDFKSARKYSRQALDLAASDPEIRQNVEKELAGYERNEPWRERPEQQAAPAREPVQEIDTRPFWRLKWLSQPELVEAWLDAAERDHPGSLVPMFLRVQSLIGDVPSADPDAMRRAENLAANALQRHPDDPWANLAMAVVRRVQKQKDEALERVEIAIRGLPGRPDAEIEKVWILAGDTWVSDASVALAKDIVARYPDDAQCHNALGAQLYNAGKLDEGLVSVRRACDLAPDVAIHWNNLGVGLTALKRFDEAAEAFGRAIAAAPLNGQFHRARADALDGAGHTAEALAAVDELIRAAPRDPQGYSHKAVVLARHERLREAVDVLSQGITVLPNESALLKLRAEAYLFLNELQSALEDATRVRRLTGDVVQYGFVMAVAEALSNRWTDALATANRLVDAATGEALVRAYAIRIEIYRHLGRDDDALADEATRAKLMAETTK